MAKPPYQPHTFGYYSESWNYGRIINGEISGIEHYILRRGGAVLKLLYFGNYPLRGINGRIGNSGFYIRLEQIA